MHNKSTAISNQHVWKYKSPVCGVVRDKTTKDDMFLVKELSDSLYSIHSVGCTGSGDGKCEECTSVAQYFYRKCKAAVDLRARDHDRRTANVNVFTSPTLAQKKVESDKKTILSYRNKVFRLEAKLQRKKGIRLPDKLDNLFDEETERCAHEYFKDKQVSDDDVSKLLFMESLKNARIAEKSGSRRVRHSPLMIRFCITLNQKLGKRQWASIAKTFHLPSQSTLSKHRSIGSHDPDGFLHGIVRGEKETFESNNGTPLDKDFEDWLRHGCLSYDSAKCCDKVIYNFQTGELMGFAYDAFDINIIEREWRDAAEAAEKKAAASESKGDKKKKSTAKKASKPKMAKHFLLFYFTSWESKCRRTQMCVARCGMNTITGSWLAETIRKIIAMLDVYGFIVDSVVADGATENRSCNNQLATLTANELLDLSFLSDMKRAILPTEKKIAFRHPTRPEITIFIWSDMPHWTKKFVNALERTDYSDSDTNLNFRGQPLSLVMLKQVWLNTKPLEGAALRTNRLAREHFEKDSFSRMRVYLAVQVVSMTMCRLIDEQIASKAINEEFYKPLREIIEKVDRVVDIFNGTVENRRGEKKGCENINSPTHKHVVELLDILALFSEWRAEAKELKNSDLFIPYTSFDDLCSMVFGLVGVAQTYLKADGSRTMVQRRGNTDVLEHCFAHIRQHERNFNVQDGRRGVARGAARRLNSYGGNNKNAPHEDQDYNTLMAPLVTNNN